MDNKVLKSSFWYIFGNILVKGSNIITIPLFTRLLTQEEFGEYNNFVSWSLILTIIATLNLDSTVSRARHDFEEDFKGYCKSIIVLGIVNTFFVFCFLIFLLPLFEQKMEMKYIFLMFAGIIFTPIINIFLYVERLKYNYRMVVIISTLQVILNILLSFLLILIMEDSLLARIIGVQLSTIIIGIGLLVTVLKDAKKCKIATKYWKYAIRISIPYIPHLLSLNVLNSIDRIMITEYCGAAYTALYSIAYTCGVGIRLVTSAINVAFEPWMTEKMHQGKYSEVEKQTSNYLLLPILITVIVVLVAPEILLVLGGKAYLDAESIMLPITLGAFYQFIYTMYVNVEQYEKKTVKMAIASVSVAVVNYVLNYYFIPLYGYQAAAYTTLFSYFLLMVIHYLIVKSIGKDKVYNTKFIFKCVCVITLVVFCLKSLLRFVFLRYLSVSLIFGCGAYIAFKRMSKLRKG